MKAPILSKKGEGRIAPRQDHSRSSSNQCQNKEMYFTPVFENCYTDLVISKAHYTG